MKKHNLIALANRISDAAHKQIIRELESRGIYGIVPSHGGILRKPQAFRSANVSAETALKALGPYTSFCDNIHLSKVS